VKCPLRTVIRLVALFLLSTCLSWWLFSGANAGWTKTYVTIPATDEVTGIEYEVKQEKFVPGVDFLAAGCGLSFMVFASNFLFFKAPNRSRTKNP